MLNLEKLIVHNFGSYSHAEVNLQNRGFCLVSGQNFCKKDNAISNGSGKSFLWSAICFALVGETVSGLHTNLKNINILDDPTCYVTLIFSEGTDHYQITRHIAPRSDLKLLKNDIDLSGKGIRESEKKLQELLPDLTKNLITSTIIIGQGMPNKFSSFSPSGRKELLEKLTRADFMIEDIKQRVTNRFTELSNQSRSFEDACLAKKSQVNLYTTNLHQKQAELASFVKPDFDKQEFELTSTINSLDLKIQAETTTVSNIEANLNEASNQLFEVTQAKSAALETLKNENDKVAFELVQKQAGLRAEIKALQSQINHLKTVTDICPTCKQKIPGATKPDTSALELTLQKAVNSLVEVDTQLETLQTEYQRQFTVISAQYEQQLTSLQTCVSETREQLNSIRNSIRAFEQSKILTQQKLARVQYDRETWDARYQAVLLDISKLTDAIANTTAEISAIEVDVSVCSEHLKMVRKMDTLIKRDFRGFLLSNIITYIDRKAKDYCNIVFGTRDLNVSLDDNNLNISYCGKMFDNLSGGEKQRVDLILQFAIRNMLTVYLNFNSNILVLDEITDFLDKKSCSAILDLITQELNTIESVFIISHHASALALPIDSEMVIQKNELGISEIISGV
jgi:DNA repair exonuclease SbcCD ATPase subunit